jgi:hypothetical protein
MKGVKTGGRTTGTPNKTTASEREKLVEVNRLLQEDDKTSLLQWAKENLSEFYTKIYPKLVPTAVDATVTMKKLGADLEEETYE